MDENIHPDSERAQHDAFMKDADEAKRAAHKARVQAVRRAHMAAFENTANAISDACEEAKETLKDLKSDMEQTLAAYTMVSQGSAEAALGFVAVSQVRGIIGNDEFEAVCRRNNGPGIDRDDLLFAALTTIEAESITPTGQVRTKDRVAGTIPNVITAALVAFERVTGRRYHLEAAIVKHSDTMQTELDKARNA